MVVCKGWYQLDLIESAGSEREDSELSDVQMGQGKVGK